jgi:hypothetical protein
MTTTGRSDYIPRNDSVFCDFVSNMILYAEGHFERWGVMAPTAEMKTALADLYDKVAICKLPTRNKVDTLVKNQARRALERDVRNYLQGMVARNVNVSDEDRKLMGLRIRDTTPTVIPPPTTPVEGELHFPAPAIVELRKIRPFGGSAGDLSTHGVRIHYGVLGTPSATDKFRLASRPETGNDLPHSVFTRRKSFRFIFTGDSGREVFFCMRFENSKGETGPWGNMMSAFVP